jgi:hypothetical protein
MMQTILGKQGLLTAFNILLVREDEQKSVLHLTIIDDLIQLPLSLLYARSVA